MKQFILDLLKESRGEKFSTKKFWGHICMLLIAITYVLDGWDFYTINIHLFDSLLIAGTTLIGIGAVTRIFEKKKSKNNETE